MARKVLSFPLRSFLSLLLLVLLSLEAQAFTPIIPMVTPGAESLPKLTSEGSKTSGSTVLPLEKVRITSKFGPRRHPVLKKAAFHGGVDMRARLNDKVKSVSDGVVTFSGPKGALGNAVFISHPKLKATSIYGHLNKVAVPKGKKVKAGAVIGYAGTTGRSTGVHLHLTVKDQRTGKSVEPISFLASIDKKTKAKASAIAYRDKTEKAKNILVASAPKVNSQSKSFVVRMRKMQLAIAKAQSFSDEKQEKLTLKSAQASRVPILFKSRTSPKVRPVIAAVRKKPQAVIATDVNKPLRDKKPVTYAKARTPQAQILVASVKPTSSLSKKTGPREPSRTFPKVVFTAKTPALAKLASTTRLKKLEPKTTIIIAASRSKVGVAAKATASQQLSISYTDMAKVAGLRSAIAQAVANAESLEGLYSEGIVARKQYLAAEQRVSQLREELRDAQSKS